MHGVLAVTYIQERGPRYGTGFLIFFMLLEPISPPSLEGSPA